MTAWFDQETQAIQEEKTPPESKEIPEIVPKVPIEEPKSIKEEMKAASSKIEEEISKAKISEPVINDETKVPEEALSPDLSPDALRNLDKLLTEREANLVPSETLLTEKIDEKNKQEDLKALQMALHAIDENWPEAIPKPNSLSILKEEAPSISVEDLHDRLAGVIISLVEHVGVQAEKGKIDEITESFLQVVPKLEGISVEYLIHFLKENREQYERKLVAVIVRELEKLTQKIEERLKSAQ